MDNSASTTKKTQRSSRKALLKLTKSQLIKQCKKKNVKIYSNYNKNELITQLLKKLKETAKKKPKISTQTLDPNKLLVYGFIRGNILNFNLFIPDTIYLLCHSFYLNNTHNLIILWKRVNDSYKLELGILDIQNKQSSTINLKQKFREYDGDYNYFVNNAFCHISNISNVLPNNITKGMKLNGIFGSYVQGKNREPFNFMGPLNLKSFPSLILYEPYNNMNVKYEFKSKFLIDCHPKQFIYCSNKNIIVYENEGKLFQLNLKNISKSFSLPRFESLKQNDRNFYLDENDCEDIQYLNMTYLPNKQSIFAIKCKYYIIEDQTDYSIEETYSSQLGTCAIFDMNNNNWINIESYNYSDYCYYEFQCINCYDSINYNIFMFENITKRTSKYDFHKNKWDIICDKINWNLKKLWIDNEILYGLWANRDKFKIYSLDLRNNKKMWNIADIYFDEVKTGLDIISTILPQGYHN
eukprot:171381_1